MTVSATDVLRGPYQANGTTTAFAAPYVLDAADLKVFTLETEEGEGTLVSADDYTVSDVGVQTGSTVTFDEAPEEGYITIVRNPARTQETRYITGARFPAESNEQAVDRLTMAAQHSLHTTARSLRAPQYEESEQPALPARSLRKGNGFGTLAGFDADGDATIYTPETPAIIRIGDIWLKYGEYGPCFNGDPVEDTIAMIAASNAASGTGRKIITRGGRLIFRTNPTSTGLTWNRDGYVIRRSIPLLSNIHYDLRDTLIMSAPHPDMPALHREDHEDVDGVETEFAFPSDYTATNQLWVAVRGPEVGDRFIAKALTTDYTVSAPGASGTVTFLVAPVEGSTVRITTERAETWIWGTSPNRTADAVSNPATENVVFQDVTFDFGAEFYDPDDVTTMPVIYGVGATSIRSLTRENNKFFNSSRDDYESGDTARRGRGMVIENFCDLNLINDKMSGVTQGVYSRYGNWMTVRGSRCDDVVEAYDHDGPIDDVTIDDGVARDFVGDKQEQDFHDFGGGKRWTVTNQKATNIGRIFGVYRKPHEASPSPTATMAEAYTEYLSLKGFGAPQADRANFMVTEDITVSHIHGESCGGVGDGDDAEGVPGSYALFAGALRTIDTWGHPNAGGWTNTALDGLVGIRNVKFSDITLIGCAPFMASDCEDLQVARMTLVNSLVENTANDLFRNAAAIFRQSNAGGTQPGYETNFTTRLTGFADTVAVYNSQGVGIQLAGVSESFVLRNPLVDGFNTLNSANCRSGIYIAQVGNKPCTIRVENAVVKGGNSSSDALIRENSANPDAWVTATAYVRGQSTQVSNLFYLCLVAHTSAALFATDLTAGRWRKSEGRIEYIGRPRLDPANGAIPIMLSDRIGHRTYPMKENTQAVADTTVATGATPIDRIVTYQMRDSFEVTGFQVIPQADAAGHASNYTRVTLFKVHAGVTTELTNLGRIDFDNEAITAGTAKRSTGTTTNDGTSILVEGDQLIVRYTRQGNGSAIAQPFPLVIHGVSFTSLST